ncbi:MAG: hypothetical protein KA914_13805 [Ottowia sp.]|nr:hypothetical protein [Ottowia sp.]
MNLRTVLHRSWRVLRWALLALVLLTACAIAALWWANRQDDALRPEVVAAMAFTPPDAEAMRRNGYFTMLGLGAPADQDALTAGQRFFAAQLADYSEFQVKGTLDSSAIRGAFPHRSVQLGATRCDAEVSDCFGHYLTHASAVRDHLHRQRSLVARYLSLRDFTDYTEVTPPYIGIVFPHYSDVVAASELVGMQAALAAHDGNSDEALSQLEANAAIHRQLASGSRTMMGAMVALAADMRQQRLIAGLARAWAPLDAGQAGRLARLLETLPPTMAATMAGELSFSLAAYGMSIPHDTAEMAWSSRVSRWFDNRVTALAYLPNATLNEAFDEWSEAIRLSELPPDQIDAAVQALGLQNRSSILTRWRNPVGQVLLGFSDPPVMLPYIERAHDVNGHRRLVQLQIAALRERVTPQHMPDWLAAQAPALRNPYTLQPMGWDAATQSLVFEGRQAQIQNPKPRNVYRVSVYGATPKPARP